MAASKFSDLFINREGLTEHDHQARMINVAHKGFEGILPAIGAIIDGTTYEAHLSNALYVSQNIIAKVLTTPDAYNYIPQGKHWRDIAVSLIEEHAKTITGFNNTVTVDTDSSDIGATGEQQESIKKTNKAKTTLTFEIPEKFHKTVSKFLSLNIFYTMKDYVTERPLASDYISSLDEIGGGWTPNMYSFSIIFIEPDVTRLGVVDAWLAVQFFFKGSGDRTAKKNLSNGGETVTLNIETAGIYMSTDRVFELAEKILPKIANIRAVPDVDLAIPVDNLEAELQK